MTSYSAEERQTDTEVPAKALDCSIMLYWSSIVPPTSKPSRSEMFLIQTSKGKAVTFYNEAKFLRNFLYSVL